MAKISIISPSLDLNTLALIKSLEEQRNDVLVITSQQAQGLDLIKGHVITPFKNWSILEAIKLFRYLMSFNPDVLHFLFSESKPSITPAHWTLSQIFQLLPHKVVASSFYQSPRYQPKTPLQFFLKACNLVTWDSRDHLMYVRRKVGLDKGIISDVLPPLQDNQIQFDKQIPVELSVTKLVSALGDYLILPGDPEPFFTKHNKKDLNLPKRFNILFLGERSSHEPLNLSYFTFNNLQGASLHFALKRAKAIVLAFNKLSVSELQHFFQYSQATNTPLIVNPSQVDDFPGLVRHQKTGWILENGFISLNELITNNPMLRTQNSKIEPSEWNLKDLAGNSLQRLYQKALISQS